MIEEKNPPSEKSLEKVPTGIKGLHDITYDGLPKDRPTLIAGSAGSGKTLYMNDFKRCRERVFSDKR